MPQKHCHTTQHLQVSFDCPAASPVSAEAPDTEADAETDEQLATIFALNFNAPGEEAEEKTLYAFDRLFNSFERAITNQAHRLARMAPDPYHTVKDLLSIGQNALWCNLQRWHPDQRRNFSRALMCLNIKGEMLQHVNAFMRVVHVPEKVVKAIVASRRAEMEGENVDDFINGGNYSESMKQLVRDYRSPGAQCAVAVEDSEDGYDTEHEEAWCTILSAEPESHMSQDVKEILLNLIDSLPPPEKYALVEYYGLAGKPGRTLEAIAKDEGVTRERIRQRIAKARKRLRVRLGRAGVAVQSSSDIL